MRLPLRRNRWFPYTITWNHIFQVKYESLNISVCTIIDCIFKRHLRFMNKIFNMQIKLYSAHQSLFLWHFLFSICIYSHSKCTWALFLYSVWQLCIWWRHYSYRILTCSHYFLNTCIYLIIPGHLAMLLYDSEARGGETKSSTEGMYCNKNAVSNSKEIPIYFRYLL